jgi:hypothetical protein
MPLSRARNIKPGFFKNELLVELPFEARLLFIGLWTMADREGRLEDRPTKIRMEIFPADSVDVEAGLQALHDNGFICRYSVNEQRFIEVLAWAKHQNPHHREAESTIPARVEPRAAAPCMKGKPEASTGQALGEAVPLPGSAVLIPDSLIPDSLQEQEPKGSLSAKADVPNCPHAEIIALYHENLPSLRQVRTWEGQRPKLLRSRWRESSERQDLTWWREFFGYVAGSDFLMGKATSADGRAFDCDLEWLIRPKSFAKVIEGKYENRRAQA